MEREMRIGVSLPVREMADDLVAIKDFAQAAEGLGLTHLRVPDQIIRPGNGHLHDAMSLLCYLAGVTQKIELVPSVIILPLRQTALIARQTAALDILSEGRLRLGIGVGASAPEYQSMGQDFHSRGRRCDEQLQLIHQLWTEEIVSFAGEFDTIEESGINPRPSQPIPIWVGARSIPSDPVVERIGKWASGWFVLASPEEYAGVKARIDEAAKRAGRAAQDIGAEAGVAVVGPRESEWQARVENWHSTGLTHLCLRTLRGDLSIAEHLPKLKSVVAQLPAGVSD
jgi:probable F420-dependent oxidoreductase